jgi:predicted dehydrogenase
MSEPIRAAVIGCGHFARRHFRHVCVDRAVAGLAITTACDRDADAARERAETFGVPHWTADTDAVLGDDGIDAVLLVTPPATHVPLAIRALGAGKAVFCEKPLSTTAEQRDALRAALAETGGRLMVGYCFRHVGAFAAARKLVAPARFTTAMVLNHEAGGLSYLTHNACHAVDALLSLHRAEVAEVTALSSEAEGARGDQFVINLRFDNGTLANLACGTDGDGSLMPKWYYKSLGGGRVAEVLSRGEGWEMHADGGRGPHTSSPYFEGHIAELEQFVRGVRTGEPFATDAESAMKVDEVIAAAREQLGFEPPA